MRNITVRNGQDVVDLSIQHSGNAEAAFDLCLQNDISLTEELENGQQMLQTDVVNKFVTQHFKTEEIAPASDAGQIPAGIGIWIIGIDFKVS